MKNVRRSSASRADGPVGRLARCTRPLGVPSPLVEGSPTYVTRLLYMGLVRVGSRARPLSHDLVSARLPRGLLLMSLPEEWQRKSARSCGTARIKGTKVYLSLSLSLHEPAYVSSIHHRVSFLIHAYRAVRCTLSRAQSFRLCLFAGLLRFV